MALDYTCVIYVDITNQLSSPPTSFFFFFNDTATTEIYTLSLHDALPICHRRRGKHGASNGVGDVVEFQIEKNTDRKSTRLNSSHSQISYAVFCLKKKKPGSHASLLCQIH